MKAFVLVMEKLLGRNWICNYN